MFRVRENSLRTVSLIGYDIVPNFEDFGLGCFLLLEVKFKAEIINVFNP